MGAAPRFDSYGRLCGATLIDLETLGTATHRRRGHAVRYLPRFAAAADEAARRSRIARGLRPMSRLNAITFAQHALAHMANARRHAGRCRVACVRQFRRHIRRERQCVGRRGCVERRGRTRGRLRQAQGLRVWRGRQAGAPRRGSGRDTRATVDVTYQNLDSIEVGVTTVDHYFDTLGGISRAVRRARGGHRIVGVYRRPDTRRWWWCVRWTNRSRLETRTRALNPKWYEGLLKHGFEGVREIEAHVTNTLGWSATTGQVAPWVYRELTETYVLDTAMRETPRDAQSNRIRQDCKPSYRSARAQLLDSRSRHAGRATSRRR